MLLATTALLINMAVQLPNMPDTTTNPSDVLKGTWQIDLTPNDTTDSNFATMTDQNIDDSQFFGEFYRTGVAIQKGQLNISNGKVYGALISADGTGQYATSFHYDGAKLHGTTHALDREFLAVWTATKQEQPSEKQ